MFIKFWFPIGNWYNSIIKSERSVFYEEDEETIKKVFYCHYEPYSVAYINQYVRGDGSRERRRV